MSGWQVYPWQGTLWQGLQQRRAQRQLPHALLLSGPPGMGKQHFADCLAHALLCESPLADGSACGHCRGCLLMQAGSHPDYLLVAPEEEGKGIGIAQIRALIEFQSLKSQYGTPRVIQLQPADRLNPAAANALLKTLEEPAGDTILILSTARPASLLPTVRSRCQQLLFRPLLSPDQASRQWLAERLATQAGELDELLQASGGAPLRVLSMIEGEELSQRAKILDDWQAMEQGRESPLKLAESWEQLGIHRVMHILYGLLADMIQLKLLTDAARLGNPRLRGNVQALAEQVDLGFLDALLLRVQERIGLLQGQVKPQVILEEILLAWKQRRV
jgi:DNA polymerase-3 subunit delta'